MRQVGPVQAKGFPDQVYCSRVCEISQVDLGDYIISRCSHVFGLSVAFAPMGCTISDTASCEVFSPPYSAIVAKLCCGWFKLEEDYFAVRISAIPPGSPGSTVEAVGSIADTAIAVMKSKKQRLQIEESPTDRITLAPPISLLAVSRRRDLMRLPDLSQEPQYQLGGEVRRAVVERKRRPSELRWRRCSFRAVIFTKTKTVGLCLKTTIPVRAPCS